jgi:hypothetical protein
VRRRAHPLAVAVTELVSQSPPAGSKAIGTSTFWSRTGLPRM